MWESSEILRILEQNSTQLRQMGVRKIGLFGSYRRGTPASESDMEKSQAPLALIHFGGGGVCPGTISSIWKIYLTLFKR